jgi:hypothetical protein
MKKILYLPGYLWAIACFLLIPVTFIKNDLLAEKLSHLSFMKVHPRFSGGDINRSYLSDGLHITVNKPVFGGLRQKGKHGFVQVRFSAIRTLPDTINQVIDYDLDGTDDFRVTLVPKTGSTELVAFSASVINLAVSTPVKGDWVIRVNLQR